MECHTITQMEGIFQTIVRYLPLGDKIRIQDVVVIGRQQSII